MELYEVLNHLESLGNYCRSMIEEPGDVWTEDLIACRIAHYLIEENIGGMQEEKNNGNQI